MPQTSSRLSAQSRTQSRTSGGVRHLLAGLALAGSLGLSTAVWAGEPPKDNQLLQDFIHYVFIDKAELAKPFGEALLKRLAPPLGTAEGDAGLKLSEFVTLIELTGSQDRFERAATEGLRSPELESTAGRLLRAYTAGKLEQARDPAQIAKNISLLVKDQRARLFGRERLVFAGEYALPQMLQALTRRTDPALSAEVRQLLVDMGKQSVSPLLAALPGLDAVSQETVLGILSEIPYKWSVPFIYDLHRSSKQEAVKKACERALTRITGAFTPEVSISDAYADLAEAYYGEEESLTSFRGEATQPYWTFNPSIGLMATPVDTRVYHEAMAMRLAERALVLDRGNQRAVSLWLASNFSRELDTPGGYENPVYGKDRRDATYYAVAAGARASQAVLGRALDAKRTPLVRKAIAAIERTAGGGTLADSSLGRNPLLESLRYPNRRVQYEAALALATAQPTSSFEGAERVVPLLGSCIRDASAKYAVVIAGDLERGNSLGKLLTGLGYTVLPVARSLQGAEGAISETPGVDMIVTDLPGPSTDATIKDVRGNARLSATPVLSLLDAKGLSDLSASYGRDEAVRLIRSGADPAAQAEAVKQLNDRATGGAIGGDDVAIYQTRALASLRDLAVSGNTVFNVADASGALTATLSTASGAIKMQIAEVMSRVGDKRLQTALMDAAMSAQGDEMIELLGKVTQSAKKFGNLLDERQIRRLVEGANAGSDAEATAKAALIGALNLPNDSIVPLILGTAAKKS